MTFKEIGERIDQIDIESDDKTAHYMKLDLFNDFVFYIANGGNTSLKSKAKVVMTINQ